MTTEEKFHAAVNVIRSLPKNGSYQPSNDLLLKFYSYFKQATQGPCDGRRPPFYDLVGRAKYDAWKKLGDMSKQTAMAKYVDELHSIIETMSYSDNVANFLDAPAEDLECVNMLMEDLEVFAGDVLERVRSNPNSPLGSREASPIRSTNTGDSLKTDPTDLSGYSDHSDDEYIDTIEFPETKKIPNGTIYNDSPKEHVSRSRTKVATNADVSHEISRAVQHLKGDIDRLTKKITVLENSSVAMKQRRGLFHGISPHFIAFVIAWPFVATFIMNRYINTRK